MNLNEFYNTHRDFFGHHLANQYPLLVKFLDCNENLSVQVHPNEQYGSINHVPSKNEAWYILEAQEDSYIVYGHNALRKDQFSKLVKEKE
jgi:mannose-6-phosphate isomerase